MATQTRVEDVVPRHLVCTAAARHHRALCQATLQGVDSVVLEVHQLPSGFHAFSDRLRVRGDVSQRVDTHQLHGHNHQTVRLRQRQRSLDRLVIHCCRTRKEAFALES